jgi:hypothetical protein
MAESQVVVRVDREMLLHFRAECMRRGSNVSKEMTRLMLEQLKAWLPVRGFAEPDGMNGEIARLRGEC